MGGWALLLDQGWEALPPQLWKLEVPSGAGQYPLTFQRLDGLGGENLEDYRSIAVIK